MKVIARDAYTEQEETEMLATKKARIVYNRARSVKLRKRGEKVWWSPYFNGWMWAAVTEPSWMADIIREDEERWTPPKCHGSNMFTDETDDEKWWECKHCGHTKEFGFLERPH